MTLLAALDRAIALAEFALDGTLLRANARYRALLDLPPHTEGQARHRDFCLPAYADSDDYQTFWRRLTQGEEMAGLFERCRANGEPCWLEATYAPNLDASGTIQSIVKVAADVTSRVQREATLNEQRRLLALVADTTDNAVLILDHHARVIYANPAFTRMFGYTHDEIAGRTPGSLLMPYRSPEEMSARRHMLRAGQSLRGEALLHGKGNIRYWCNIGTNPVMDASGKLVNAVAIYTDITHAKLHEVLQQRVLEAMARDQPLSDVLSLVCQEVERIAPAISASILEVDDHQVLHPLAAPGLPEEYSQAIDGTPIGPNVGSCGTAAYRNEPVAVTDIASDPLWADFRDLALSHGLRACWSTPICAADGRVIGTFALYYRQPGEPLPFHQEIIQASVNLCTLALERERSRSRIRQLAFYDVLTGLPNRHLLHAKADQTIAGAARAGSTLAVLFLDVDRFKQVNDSLGHPAGDALLRAVANILREEITNDDFAGRLSGDEFIVVLTDCTQAQAADAAERILQRLTQSHAIGQTTLNISASVGIAMFPCDGRDTQTLLHRADLAMYHAKTNGRGRASFFNSEMNALAQERLALEMALRHAVQSESLRLHYQPQINLKTGQLYGVEALARWHDAERGDISPARFIPLAEESGLIADLGHWALREACRQLAIWRRHGLAVPAVSVNLSPTSFHNLDLPRMIAGTLALNGLQPHDLTLEITESILLDTNPSTLMTLTEVHKLGVHLSMDDFGTGYSSLSYLRRLPVTELKLDKSFVAELGKDEDRDKTAQALSDAVLRIGESLHLTVVAEGVETDQQRSLLSRQGYHAAQGYLYSPPLSPSAFEDWLRQHALASESAPG